MTFDDILENRVPKELIVPYPLNMRAFHVVFMYLTTQQHIYRLLSTVGFNPKFLPFDGVQFHILYLIWPKLSKEETSKRITKIFDYRMYAHVRSDLCKEVEAKLNNKNRGSKGL